MEATQMPPTGERRDFIKKFLAILTGAVAAIVPALAGLAVFLDPLRRRAEGGDLTFVAALEAVPADGTPRKFPVLAERSDAWNRYPASPIGAVYLRRLGGGAVQAVNVACPHAGCFVDYLADRGYYLCPCHNSSFHRDGAIRERSSPSPRALDTLPVEIREGSQVWVRFQNFRGGTAQKIPRV